MDFLNRVDIKLVGKAVIEKLINTGAYDLLGTSREKLLGNLERAVEYVQNQKEEKQFGQSSLFGDTDEKEYADLVFEDFPPKSQSDKLKIEKQLIGFYLSGHPLDEYRELWQKAVKVDLGRLAANLDTLEPGSHILLGVIKNVKTVNSKGGKMAYAAIEDYNGEIDMIFFPRVWEACQDRVQDDKIAIFRGKIDYQRDKYSFIAEAWIDMREAKAALAEEEALRRKREKFRSAWLYAADLKGGSLAAAKKGGYTVIGQLASLREMQDKNGNDMALGTLRDFEGSIDLVFFSKVWSENRDLLNLDEFVALRGNIDPAGDRNPQRPGFKVSGIADLAALSRSAARKAAAGEKPEVPAMEKQPAATAVAAGFETAQPALNAIHIRLNCDAAGRDDGLFPLRNYLAKNAGPCPVFIHIPAASGGGSFADDAVGKADGLTDEKVISVSSGLSLEAEREALGVLEGCDGVMEAWKEQCDS
jgi:DNA polymerase-3 subunit alpha